MTNRTRNTVNWVVHVQIAGRPYEFWNGVYNQQGHTLTVTGADWNRTLAPRASTSFGFCAYR